MNNICNNTDILEFIGIFGYVLLILKYAIPLIIIIYSTIDIYKIVINPDDKKNFKQPIRRIIAGLLIFFLPSIIMFIFSKVGVDTKNDCIKVLLDPTNTTLTTVDITNVDENECNNLGKPYIWKDSECKIDMTGD